MWNLDIKVDDEPDANWSLAAAEAFGTALRPRPILTQKQFKTVVTLFEEHRDWTESKLQDFDEDTQSWRSYAGAAFEFIPHELYRQAHQLIKEYGDEHPNGAVHQVQR